MLIRVQITNDRDKLCRSLQPLMSANELRSVSCLTWKYRSNQTHVSDADDSFHDQSLSESLPTKRTCSQSIHVTGSVDKKKCVSLCDRSERVYTLLQQQIGSHSPKRAGAISCQLKSVQKTSSIPRRRQRSQDSPCLRAAEQHDDHRLKQSFRESLRRVWHKIFRQRQKSSSTKFQIMTNSPLSGKDKAFSVTCLQ